MQMMDYWNSLMADLRGSCCWKEHMHVHNFKLCMHV